MTTYDPDYGAPAGGASDIPGDPFLGSPDDLPGGGVSGPVVDTGGLGDDPGSGGFSVQHVMYMAPWLPPELAQIVLDEWARTGDWQLALGAMRASPLYDEYFRGNRRDDGSLRYDEADYYAMIEGFRNRVDDFGINPDLFVDDYVNLIIGGVKLGEFEQRLDRLAERVLVQSDAMRQHFAAELGVALSDEAMIAALMSPNVNDALLNRQITEAEIMTEASLRGFSADAFDERLYDFGYTRESAAQLFGAAADMVPVLDVLATRHNDPDDDFSLSEFVDAMAFSNRTQRLRYRRLLAQEASLFSGGITVKRDDVGALTGLAER